MNAKVQNQVARAGLWFTGFFILALLAAFLGYILYKGLPVLSPHFILGKSSDMMAGGGVGSQLFNSFYMLFLSMAISIPIALGAGIYLAEYARENKLTKCIRLSVESLATVPSIVLGLFGMIVFVNMMNMGFSILGGSLTLVLLNLPMLVRVTEESIRTVPKSYEEASLALGATKLQTIFKVVLPSAMRKLTRTSSGRSVPVPGTGSSCPVRRHDTSVAPASVARQMKMRMIPFGDMCVNCQIPVFCQTIFHEWMLMLMLIQRIPSPSTHTMLYSSMRSRNS